MPTEPSWSLESVLHRLPPFPAALAAVMHVCASESCGVAEIAQAVAMEEVLAAKVVRAANAVSQGAVQVVDNLVAAVGRLGSSAVRGLTVASFLGASVAGAAAAAALDRETLWRHNLAVAAASSGAAGSGAERSNAYFAGLVHDVGKMIFAAELGSGYAECLQEAANAARPLQEVETARFGLDHAELGAEAAQGWGFATDVVDAIAHHHHFGASLTNPLASHVTVGDQVANAMGYPAIPLLAAPDAAGGAAILQSVTEGIMSRAQWALTRDLPRIEAMISTVGI